MYHFRFFSSFPYNHHKDMERVDHTTHILNIKWNKMCISCLQKYKEKNEKTYLYFISLEWQGFFIFKEQISLEIQHTHTQKTHFIYESWHWIHITK